MTRRTDRDSRSGVSVASVTKGSTGPSSTLSHSRNTPIRGEIRSVPLTDDRGSDREGRVNWNNPRTEWRLVTLQDPPLPTPYRSHHLTCAHPREQERSLPPIHLLEVQHKRPLQPSPRHTHESVGVSRFLVHEETECPVRLEHDLPT